MPGKRINNPSLQPTWYDEAINNDALLLTDWTGLEEARPIPLKYVGNSWFQGSYDNVTWSNTIQDDHNYARVSTDGGTEWIVFNLAVATTHPGLTLGSPANGLVLDESNQVLTLSYADGINGGALTASHYTKISNLKFDVFINEGAGYQIYKNYLDTGDNRNHSIRSLVAGTGTTLSYVGDTIVIESTGAGGGQNNLGANVATEGVGVFDGMNGVYLNFRGIASIHSGLTVTLDDTDNDIDLDLDEANINHDILLNYVANEHINHSTTSISTTEGITGGGDLTTTRTLSLSFDTLATETTLIGSDVLAFYRTGDDLHHGITYDDIETQLIGVTNTLYVPLARTITPLTGLTGGGALSSNLSIGLGFNNLPVATFDPAADYIAIYDASNGNHAKILVGAVTSVNLIAGAGMYFSNITGSGTIAMGTPTALTESSTNSASGSTHTHAVDLSTWELDDLGDVPAPTALYYLRRNAGNTAYEWVDPAIGASVPGGPDTAFQYNNNGVFAGNSGFTYDESSNSINLSDPVKLSSFNMGGGAVSLFHQGDTFYVSNVTGSPADEMRFTSGRFGFGQASTDPGNFFQVKSLYGDSLGNVFVVRNTTDDNVFIASESGDVYMPELSSAVSLNMLYFDTVTGKITYGAKPTTSGGIQTIITDSLSGLSVNAGNSSSAASIELDQNDNKLTSAIPVLTDYIGFYDVSSGLQSKTALQDIPSWNLSVNNSPAYNLGLGDTLSINGGAGINLSYSTGALTISSNGGGGGCNQSVADLGTVSTGTVNLDMNSYASAIITLSAGGTITISMNNLQEGDTGHIEVTHTGVETLKFSSSGAVVKIAANSYKADSTVVLSGGGGIDIVAYWFAKGNLHLACIYNMG